MRIRKTLGIDLGTTNSVIALLDPTDSALVTGRDVAGRATLPSVLARPAHQDRLVAGHVARQLRRARQPLVSSVKRHLGLERRFDLGEQSLSAVEVSAHILRHCRDVMAATLADPRYLLDAAIITMPAYFNHNQIEETRRAGELAGFQVVELLHEPTAAAIYYSWIEGHQDATYLVYDLGGGTFDVSIIRKRFDDYEVLGVSGDPFLGGDDFDRLLASHLQERLAGRIDFDLQSPDGKAHFAALVDVAERLKIDLSEKATTEVRDEVVAQDREGKPVRLTARVERSLFQGLIKDKVHRTVECCHEALARAKAKSGLELSDIDRVILVGGSSRIPLVRETIRAAFCNERLPQHVRQREPLLHEPDLCVAYGAALRAATHGTRFVFPVARVESAPSSILPELDMEGEENTPPPETPLIELHWTSPVNVRETRYTLTGVARGTGAAEVRHGGSLRIRCFASGLTEELFVNRDGTFALELELQPETDNAFEVTVCDNLGQELARFPACVRHRAVQEHGSPGLGVLPTQLITKPLSIEVLDRKRQRVKQIVAPVGAALPGTFQCVCRTVDQSGRVVVPIFEENRVIKQLVLDGLDRRLQAGSPVDVEFRIDVRHSVEVRVRVREANRSERVVLEGPPPPHVPTSAEIAEVKDRLEALLAELSGGFRARVKARLEHVLKELFEARHYEDEPKAIQRMAELRELLQEAETERGRQLEPPWPRFAQLAQHCRTLVAEAARITGRDRAEMLDYVRTQERLAERAFHERNQPLYRDSWANLERYLYQIQELCRPSAPVEDEPDDPETAARAEVERFRGYLSHVWKEVRLRGRKDLEERLNGIARQSQGLTQQVKDDPQATVRSVRRWLKELHKIDVQAREGREPGDGDATSGLLEGTL